eukprot:m.47827 g.47827  ORF g.47827 m.47827 type:complete len:56 (+) comp10797_c0_seq1:890-1057(+)
MRMIKSGWLNNFEKVIVGFSQSGCSYKSLKWNRLLQLQHKAFIAYKSINTQSQSH